MVGGIKCVERRRGQSVFRDAMKSLCYILYFPNHQENPASAWQMCPYAWPEVMHIHTHTLLGLKQDPRGSSISLSAAQMRLHISKM